MPFANNGGVRIHYRVVGEGPPLVLHHGFTQDLKRWYLCGYVGMLYREYQLILIDPRGHGRSDKLYDPAAYAMRLRVDDVVAVLDCVRAERVTFWGYSDGGRIGYAMPLWAPDRLRAVIIGGHDPYEQRVPEIARVAAQEPDLFLRRFIEYLGGDFDTIPPPLLAELQANDFRALAAAQSDEPSLEHALPLMKMPSLLYAGKWCPHYRRMRKAMKRIPNGTFLALPKLTHPLAFWARGQVLPHIRQFLRRVHGQPPDGTLPPPS